MKLFARFKTQSHTVRQVELHWLEQRIDQLVEQGLYLEALQLERKRQRKSTRHPH